MTTAIFVGSFDPYTIGHDDIARRALRLVDHLVIGVGVNEQKQCRRTADECVASIQALYADEPRVEVKAFSDLAVDLAHREGARFIVKGVRSTRDFEYERDQADANRLVGDVETILLCADPAKACVSSTLVRTLEYFGKDTTPFLPAPIQPTSKQ